VLYLPNHGINSRVFCDRFSMILVFARARYLAILTLNQVLWLLVLNFTGSPIYHPPSRFSQERVDTDCLDDLHDTAPPAKVNT
jgi:hypothetical protein